MGQLVEPRSNKTGGLADPYRSLKTTNASKLKAGDVLIGGDSRKYLLMDNGVQDLAGVDYKTYKVLELNSYGTYSTVTNIEDAVTRRTIKGSTAVDTIWFSLDPLRNLEDKLSVPTPQYMAVTYYPVVEGAFINNDQITRVEKRLGIYQFWMRSGDAPKSL
jgi:hypothetical protein